MDKTQLITIVIAAIAGAVAKALVEWIVSIIKTAETVVAVSAKIKTIFSKANREVLTDFLSLLFYAAVLVNFAIRESAPTRFEILLIIGASLAFIIMLFMLFWHVSEASRKRHSKT